MLKKLSILMVFVLVAVSLFGCTLNSKTTLEFTAFPETEYQVGEVSKEEFLNAVKVRLNGKDYSLTQLEVLGANIAGVELSKPGTYTLVVNYEGTSIIFEYDVVGLNQASVNGVEYESIIDAFAAANAETEQVTVKLLKNVDLTGNSLTVAKTANIKFDLNGNVLYCLNEVQGAAYLIQNLGKLEIIGNGTISFLAKYPDLDWGTEEDPYPSYASNTINNRGNLIINGNVIIENQTFGGAAYAIDNYDGSSLTIEEGIICQTSGGNCAIRIFGGTTNVTINGGEISANKTAIWIQLPGSKIENTPNINLTINGGKIYSYAQGGNLMYTYTFGDSHSDVVIDINGGEFLGGYVSIGSGTHKLDIPQFTIDGGTFEYDVIQWTDEGYEVLKEANK